jgi:hypothetical protein
MSCVTWLVIPKDLTIFSICSVSIFQYERHFKTSVIFKKFRSSNIFQDDVPSGLNPPKLCNSEAMNSNVEPKSGAAVIQGATSMRVIREVPWLQREDRWGFGWGPILRSVPHTNILVRNYNCMSILYI